MIISVSNNLTKLVIDTFFSYDLKHKTRPSLLNDTCLEILVYKERLLIFLFEFKLYYYKIKSSNK